MADAPKPSKREEAAALCRAMAERIDRQEDADFSGALLVISPDGSKVEMVMVDPSLDVAAFWGIAKTKVDIAAGEALLAEEKRQQQGGRW